MGNFDFTGFKFGDWSSYDDETTGEVTVFRVSGGDRYEEELHPEIKDKTAEVPGMDGEYYFGSDFGTKSFNIDIAFDHLTEEQFRKLRRAFATKKIKQLIFKERPYKYYMAKLENPIELSYVCFDEPKRHIVGKEIGDERYGVQVEKRIPITETIVDEETQESTTIETGEYSIVRKRIYPYEFEEGTERVYKGEGKIALKAYFPFAKSVYKQLPATEIESDWVISSGLLTASVFSEQDIDEYIYDSEQEKGIIKIYNAGDIETGFRLYIPFTNGTISACNIIYDSGLLDGEGSASLYLKQIEKISDNDKGILINTTNGLIQGASDLVQEISGNYTYNTTGNIYNKYIDHGYLFKLQPTENPNQSTISITGITNAQIFYDYLYF